LWSGGPIRHAATGAAAAAPSQVTTSYQLSKAGQITAGGNLTLTGTGDLTNAGDLAAAGKVGIKTPGTFTNKGVYDSKITTTPGCVAGAPDCPGDSNPRVDSLAWQQTPGTVAAGQTLTISAANIQNLNATLAAQGDISLNATSSVTNRSFSDRFVNQFGASGTGRFIGKKIDSATTVAASDEAGSDFGLRLPSLLHGSEQPIDS